MDEKPIPETPFDSAWQYIKDNDGSAAEAFGKLYLSFWDSDNFPFPVRECVYPLDSERRIIALDMISYFFKHGAGERVCRHAPNILAKYARIKRKSKYVRDKPKSDAALNPDKDVADLLWKLKRISQNVGRAVANHDFDDAHAETGRLSDVIEHYEETHSNKTV